MSSTSANNKRIAKNTILLYVRMAFNMLVGLYTSRVTLAALGVEDFGVYNVVGGFVGMFSMISGSLAAAISRFLTFELGRGDAESLKRVFSTAVTIQFILSSIILVLCETVGLWFVNTQLVIPPDRIVAAHVVYQCSVVSFILGLVSIPYSAVITAHEKFSFFAVISIAMTIARLLVALAIALVPIDKLIYYAALLALLGLVDRLIQGAYCSRHFPESHFRLVVDKELMGKMLSFAGYNSFGCVSSVLMSQGVNVLVNMFYGVAFNAARGVAGQIESAVGQFSSSFTTALNPQITKEYAQGNNHRMLQLVYSGSKLSFMLMLLVSLPVLFEAETILGIWLVSTPDYAVLFTRLSLMIALLSVISNTLITSMLATGRIRNYQIVVGGLGMLIFPVVWVLYKFGFPVYVSYIVHISIFVAQLAARLIMLRKMVGLDVLYFLRQVLLRDVAVVAISSVTPLFLIMAVEPSAVRTVLSVVVSMLSVALAAYYVGLSPQEKTMVLDIVGKLFKRKTNR